MFVLKYFYTFMPCNAITGLKKQLEYVIIKILMNSSIKRQSTLCEIPILSTESSTTKY
jgi:hypothetical protein